MVRPRTAIELLRLRSAYVSPRPTSGGAEEALFLKRDGKMVSTGCCSVGRVALRVAREAPEVMEAMAAAATGVAATGVAAMEVVVRAVVVRAMVVREHLLRELRDEIFS